ncbi:MAG TPA: amidohydrolase family protein [Candidatus Acidoferrales bacterium]|nr:amidohydrolase family protein [Candidatus Acidoferrales bacterium]
MATSPFGVVVDGDGHIFEDEKAILGLMPPAYRADGNVFNRNLFPPIDHLHSANLLKMPPGSFPDVGAAGWLEFLDDVGIEAAVLYPTRGLAYGKIVNREWAIDVARAYNDWLYQAYLKTSPRFRAVGLIPLQEPGEAVKELRRIVEKLGFCGAMIPSMGLKGHLGGREYWPVYEEAHRLGCCLGIHGGAHEGLGMDYLSPYAPVHALGHPFGQMIAFGGIVFNGIFDKFPNLKIGFLEAGVAWLLVCLERFDRSWETHIQYDPEGAYLKLCPGEKVSEYIVRQIEAGRIFIGCEGNEPLLAQAVRTVGNKPFMFSSDFPHEVNDEICKKELAELVHNEELAEQDREAFLHRNAERFYGLAR